MKFMGSKNRIAKEILPIMLASRKDDQTWVEPFVGGGNLIDKVSGPRLGSDADKFVISALVSIRDNIDELPRDNSEFSEEDYRELRYSEENPHKGYCGFSLSYGGKWLGGWRRDSTNKRDYVLESYKNAQKQSVQLQGVELICCEYDKLEIPENSIIYCDPPYFGTTGYNQTFNHNKFWEWCRMISKNHTLFVSEYTAPDDFECIWSKDIVSSLTKDTGSKIGCEKLFKFEGY